MEGKNRIYYSPEIKSEVKGTFDLLMPGGSKRS